ncbi:hypothetical protein FLA_4383 [Filimonas lacunae]|nr:hypothetical protein FLA_4383 [Filimonas lacunae]
MGKNANMQGYFRQPLKTNKQCCKNGQLPQAKSIQPVVNQQ